MAANLENTWISSCSVQVGPKLATKSVGHGVLFCGMWGTEVLCCWNNRYCYDPNSRTILVHEMFKTNLNSKWPIF